jgi:hypothetical protein
MLTNYFIKNGNESIMVTSEKTRISSIFENGQIVFRHF